MTPEGIVKKEIANVLLKSKSIFGIQIFFWYNSSTGIFDPKTKRFRMNMSKHTINGVSDILGITENGTFVAIEVKAGKNKTSPAQDLFLKKIESMNGIAIVAYSSTELIKKMAEALKKSKDII
jgi:hypothetical protein